MVLVSRDSAYTVREFITVAPVTTRVRQLPVEVLLGPDDGLPRTSAANLDSMTIEQAMAKRNCLACSIVIP